MTILGFIGGVGGGEMVMVFVVFLLLFGAKKMPGIARSLGKSMEEFRRAARDVREEFMNADTEPPKPYVPPPVSESTPGESGYDGSADPDAYRSAPSGEGGEMYAPPESATTGTDEFGQPTEEGTGGSDATAAVTDPVQAPVIEAIDMDSVPVSVVEADAAPACETPVDAVPPAPAPQEQEKRDGESAGPEAR